MQNLNLDPSRYVPPSNTAYSNPDSEKEYPGIGRLGYFLSMLGLGVLNSFLTPSNRLEEPSPFVGLFILAVALVFVVNRLRNIGTSGWWALLTLVPIANLWIGFKCLVAQEGYQDSDGLDSAGKLLCGIVFALFGICILIIVVAFIGSGL